MLEIINSIFGQYQALIDPVTEGVVIGVAGVDWPWIAGVLLFAICLYSFFRILGSLVKR